MYNFSHTLQTIEHINLLFIVAYGNTRLTTNQVSQVCSNQGKNIIYLFVLFDFIIIIDVIYLFTYILLVHLVVSVCLPIDVIIIYLFI